MKCRQDQSGIALITTLIMLSVVTLMAVAFLAVSRRERAAVTVSTDRYTAQEMADAGLQRAEAEIIARVLATTNILNYDFIVSTNYFNPAGFEPGNTNIANVNFRYQNGQPVTGNDLLQLYRNLAVEPRAPVFVATNEPAVDQDFRYSLDYNRNGLVETNGIQLEVGPNGQSLGLTNFHVGDPEWIGVLRRPDLPHSGSNHFVGRFAYMILPVGKTLDLNFIHNHAKRTGPAIDGFYRNQGVGGWEINLAAFLHDLNFNAWPGYSYVTGNVFAPSIGLAFDDALALLQYRYTSNSILVNPQSVQGYFGADGVRAFTQDYIDGYSDGPLQLDLNRPVNQATPPFNVLEDDVTTRPWPGSDSPSQFFDIQELFTVSDITGPSLGQFTNRLISISNTNLSTYNRHTLYRLLAQLGTDSIPDSNRKIHLNYDNRLDFNTNLTGAAPGPAAGYHVTNFVAWSPSAFFTNVADQILKKLQPPPTNGLPLVAVTNIAVWPTNYYTPAVHRSLQLAANIYDATTNRGAAYPFSPSVFKPLFNSDPGVAGGIRIVGYEEIPPNLGEINLFWNTTTAPGYRDMHFAGVPLVIGARKGYPNFNEFRLLTTANATRKLEFQRRSPSSLPSITNQMYILSIGAEFGVEFWNSYNDPFPRTLELRTRVEYSISLSNEVRAIRQTNYAVIQTNRTFTPSQWAGRQFFVPIQTNIAFLPPSVYVPQTGTFIPVTNAAGRSLFQPTRNFEVPVWRLNVTNRVQAMLIDHDATGGPRIVDYVDLNNLVSRIDITRELAGEDDSSTPSSVTGLQTSQTAQFWRTNRVQGMPVGVQNQIQVSLGQPDIPDWRNFSGEPLTGQDKQKAQQRFREFLGLDAQSTPLSPTLRLQAPFSPSRKLFQDQSWEVNDPLVNDLVWDLTDLQRTNLVERRGPFDPIPRDPGGIGGPEPNTRYRPWIQGKSSAPEARRKEFNVAYKDPQISSSDAWDFPTNAFPSIGWLGRVHRGTPWQTVYLKSTAVPPLDWRNWTGHPEVEWPQGVIPLGTQPTNDWRILDLFTVAPNENASRGRLSVNQDGLAAWSAVLSGVPVLTNTAPSTNFSPMVIQPNTTELGLIVQGINQTRVTRFGQKFTYMGEILSTPQLTVASPYLRMSPTQLGVPVDAAVERIPQMILSLLRADEPRFAVLAYGQSLRPAPGSVITEPGDFFQMPTNYVITGEYVTKTLMHLEQSLEPHPITGVLTNRIRAVKDTYNEIPPTED